MYLLMTAGSAAGLDKPAKEEPRRGRRRAEADGASPGQDAADARAANPLESVVGYKLRRAQLVTFQEFIEFFATLKLRPAEFALITVLQHQPGLSQTDAASMLGIKRANFVALLDSLEKRGFAERRTVRGDRRSRALHLTDAGRRLAVQATRIAASYDDMLVSRLGGPQERDRFLDMLDRLMERS